MTNHITLPIHVETIINRLTKNGFDAFAVGGCVRDSLMGITPHDWDICTSALPEEVKGIFGHVIPTGEKHGTVTVMLGNAGFEVTTFRTDGIYTDGRHPDSVEFTRSLEHDLMRRDFTINAMAFNNTVGLVDIFNGAADIENRVIRCVGNPDERFAEDALRMMRAIRFSAQTGFRIAPTTYASIARNSANIKHVSFERIRDEIMKTVTSGCPEGFSMFNTSGLLVHIAPELVAIFGFEQTNPHHWYDVGTHTLLAMRNIENTIVFRLAMLFHDTGKVATRTIDDNGIHHFIGHESMSAKITRTVMTRLKFDNDTVDSTTKLVEFHMAQIAPTKASVKRWLNRIGSVNEFLAVMSVQLADASAQNLNEFTNTSNRVSECIALAGEINEAGEAFDKSRLAVNGHDLISIGVPQSRLMGEIIDRLVEIVIDNPELNTRGVLLEIAKEMM